MRHVDRFITMSFILAVGAVPVLAQKAHGNGPMTKPQTQAHPAGKPAGAPKPQAQHQTVPKAPVQHAAVPKTGGGNPHKTATTTTANPAATTTVTPTTLTSAKVKNPQLEQRLLLLLPPGTRIADASRGFKNWGQFVAAVHVSQNLNIPFADLKARMTGIPVGAVPGTTLLTTPMSLGQAIQSLKTTSRTPVTSSTVQTQVQKAESEAEEDLRVASDDRRR